LILASPASEKRRDGGFDGVMVEVAAFLSREAAAWLRGRCVAAYQFLSGN
jgi:hypothetical protein